MLGGGGGGEEGQAELIFLTVLGVNDFLTFSLQISLTQSN